MDKRLPLIVKFEVNENKLKEFITEIKKILEPTRNEEGCILYELHQDLHNPNILMFYEIWETVDHWKAHDKQPHIETFRRNTAGFAKNVEFNKLTIL